MPKNPIDDIKKEIGNKIFFPPIKLVFDMTKNFLPLNDLTSYKYDILILYFPFKRPLFFTCICA